MKLSATLFAMATASCVRSVGACLRETMVPDGERRRRRRRRLRSSSPPPLHSDSNDLSELETETLSKTYESSDGAERSDGSARECTRLEELLASVMNIECVGSPDVVVKPGVRNDSNAPSVTTSAPTTSPTSSPTTSPTSAPTTSPTSSPSNDQLFGVEPPAPSTSTGASATNAPTMYPQNTCYFDSPMAPGCPVRMTSDAETEDRRLYPNEFLCSPNLKYRFGVTTDYQLCLCDENDRKLWCAADCCDDGDDDDDAVEKAVGYYDGGPCPYASLRRNGRLVVYRDNPLLGTLGRQVRWYAGLETEPRWRDVAELAVTDDGEAVLRDANDPSGALFWRADVENHVPYHPPTPAPTTSPRPTPFPTTSPRPSVSASPTSPPTVRSTSSPTRKSTFEAGVLVDRPAVGARLSKGLRARIIGRTGTRVVYADGSRSLSPVHEKPDAGACLSQPDGGWIYVSNSEVAGEGGGVGAFTFRKNGALVDYRMVQTGSRMNCGGGATPWNTFLTGEEYKDGRVWEIDPTGRVGPRPTVFGRAKFESAICDERDATKLTCFATVDSETEGALRRFRPRRSILEDAVAADDFSDVLHGDGTLDYLRLDFPTRGAFSWTRDLGIGNTNAEEHFPNAEGIDHHDGRLYFVSKVRKELTVLDLDRRLYTRHSTESGAFAAQPDQITHLIGDDPNGSAFLYFLEDGGTSPGVFGRNQRSGRYFTVLEKIPDEQEGDETTGLAFCDDHTRMIVAFQDTGLILEVRREDGLPFYGAMANVKYHQTNRNRGGGGGGGGGGGDAVHRDSGDT